MPKFISFYDTFKLVKILLTRLIKILDRIYIEIQQSSPLNPFGQTHFVAWNLSKKQVPLLLQ